MSCGVAELFLSTPSARRATICIFESSRRRSISIHALREEGDPRHHLQRTSWALFLSTPSARRATQQAAGNQPIERFLSTPSARRATDQGRGHILALLISIHALREEGDRALTSSRNPSGNFYPRPPRGGRPAALRPATPEHWISIHALREEGDLSSTTPLCTDWIFLSTPSARRATRVFILVRGRGFISIHALREEGDSLCIQCTASAKIISIHALREEGDLKRAECSYHAGAISIHALREEGDRRRYVLRRFWQQFLSTPSARRATSGLQSSRTRQEHFYPRPPRGGRQQKQRQNLYFQTNYTTFCTNLEEP